MRVLGVDPGSSVTGWGLVGGSPRSPRLLECGTLVLDRRMLFAERLFRLQSRFDQLVERLEPTEAAVESPFHGASARAALQLAHARGVILAVLAGARIPLEEYTPATIKQSVTGNGRAEKEQVRRMVEQLLGSCPPPSAGHDLSDALAVALCHVAGRGMREALARADGR